MIPKRNMVPNNHAGAQVDIFTRVQVQFPGYLKCSSDRPLRTTFFYLCTSHFSWYNLWLQNEGLNGRLSIIKSSEDLQNGYYKYKPYDKAKSTDSKKYVFK